MNVGTGQSSLRVVAGLASGILNRRTLMRWTLVFLFCPQGYLACGEGMASIRGSQESFLRVVRRVRMHRMLRCQRIIPMLSAAQGHPTMGVEGNRIQNNRERDGYRKERIRFSSCIHALHPWIGS